MENGFSNQGWSLRCALALGNLLVLGFGTESASFAKPVLKKSIRHVPGELVVKFSDSVVMQGSAFSSLQKRLGPASVLDIRPFKTDRSFSVVRISRDKDLTAAMEFLSTEPSVLYSERNYIYHTFDDGKPNDPDFARLWGIKNTGQTDTAGQIGLPGADINVLPLWGEGFQGDRRIVVAVIDTGVDWVHPDLADNLYTNTAESQGTNGKDDDRNGFVDDLHGWNFGNNTNNSRDDHNHGTHVSGTIGGVGNNGVGVSGVNWRVSILPVKFLDANGSGTLDGAVQSIQYASLMNVNIMSNSWGGGGFSQSMKDAIVAAHKKGILFVAAAGNDGGDNDSSPTYPASYDVANVVAVAATDNQDKLASFSNYGIRSVHVAAPGVKVYSTVREGRYETYSGTSMATPHVSGISALLMAGDPALTFDRVKERLIQTSDPLPGLKRKVMSKGRVNAHNAFHGIIPPNTDPDESLWKDVSFTVESPHPYKEGVNLTYTVSQPGVQYIRLHFQKIEVENRYDTVSVEKADGTLIDQVTGTKEGYTSEYIKGDTAIIRLRSDSSVNGWGFKVDKIQVIAPSPLALK